MDPDRLLQQELLARTLRGPAAVPAAEPERPEVADLYGQLETLQGTPLDYSGVEKVSKGRIANARRDALAGMALASIGGSSFKDVGGHILKQALGDMEPLRPNLADVGYVDPETGSFVENPMTARMQKEKVITGRIDALVREEQARANRLLAEGRLAESQRAHENAEYWKGRAHALAERRVDIAENKADAAARKGDAPKAVSGLVSSDGRPVYRSADGYFVHADGTPISGPPLTTAESVKAAEDLKKGAIGLSSAEDLLKEVDANPNAFGWKSATASFLPESIRARGEAQLFSDKELQLRARIGKQAYEQIHALAGAALSMGEAGRLDRFAININTDPPEVVAAKLRGAIAEFKKIIEEKRRLGGVTANPASVPGAPPPGAASTPMAPKGRFKIQEVK
jgi:hypothetical protein